MNVIRSSLRPYLSGLTGLHRCMKIPNVHLSRAAMSTSWSDDDASHDPLTRAEMMQIKYGKKKTDNIVQVLNSYTEEQLLKEVRLPKNLVDPLMKHRDTCGGSFPDIGAVFETPGIITSQGLIIMQHINKYLQYAVVPADSTDKIKLKCEPKYVVNRQDVQTICDLHFYGYKISAVVMTRNSEVVDVRIFQLFEGVRGFSYHMCFEEVVDIIRQLPKCDLYVTETDRYRKNKAKTPQKFQEYYARMETVRNLTMTLLNNDYLQTNEHKMYMFDCDVVTKYWNLNVGGLRASSLIKLDKILNGVEVSDIKLSPESKDLFDSFNNDDKDMLGEGILTAKTFLDLMVLQLHKEKEKEKDNAELPVD